MYFIQSAFSLAFLAGFVLAQSTQLKYPPPGSTLKSGCDTIVQVFMGGYPENIDVVAIVIGLATCFGGKCSPASSFMGSILYQGPYTPAPGEYYANYTVTIPENFPSPTASLNVINFFMVGEEYVPIVDYLNEDVTIVNA